MSYVYPFDRSVEVNIVPDHPNRKKKQRSYICLDHVVAFREIKGELFANCVEVLLQGGHTLMIEAPYDQMAHLMDDLLYSPVPE